MSKIFEFLKDDVNFFYCSLNEKKKFKKNKKKKQQ